VEEFTGRDFSLPQAKYNCSSEDEENKSDDDDRWHSQVHCSVFIAQRSRLLAEE